jgi:hypothetical protein
MKRALASLAGLGLVLVIGCVQEYDFRMAKTIDNKRYQKRLNDNLEAPPAKTNLQTGNIFVRPPKGLQGPHKTFGLAVLEPGKFDVEDTFADPQKQASLHILARVTVPKPPGKKASSPAETTQRGDFTDDVLELLKNAYGADFDKSRLKNDEKKSPNGRTNSFKSLTLDLTAKEIKVYLIGEKNSLEKVALIFDYPKEEARTLSSKINLCLESFAVGGAATRLFAGAGDDEFGGDHGGAGTTAPAGVF